MHEELAAFEPQTNDERLASARAVHEQRQRDEEDALLDDLTDRERDLIEIAFGIGASNAAAKVHGVIGVAAVTLDAETVRRVISHPASPRVRKMQPPIGYDATPHRIARSYLARQRTTDVDS